MLAAPWLARNKAHVFIDAITQLLPEAALRLVAKFVYLVCTVISLVVSYASLLLLITAITEGQIDTRAVDMPLWALFAPIPPCFLLVAIEFLQFLLGFDTASAATSKRALEMEWYWAFALLLGMIVTLLAIGFPVALAFVTVNVVGWLYFSDWNPESTLQVVSNSTILISRFTLGPVPMFIMMGSLFFHTGLAVRVFDGLDVLFGRLPGRLCYLTVAGGALFATLTGSSMANTAMLGSLMVPEMQRRGYSGRMAMGPVLRSGSLAMIIPPSALGVLLAAIAGIDVGQLLVAGFIPGFLLAALFAAMIWLQLLLNPSGAPAYDVQTVLWGQRLRIVVMNILPMSVVVFMVVGFIILGWATPTESAALGVAGVMILAAAYRALTWKAMLTSIGSTVRVGAMVFSS
jgi:TRAP-type mannitol/chloroaromatic compound transport system permease large subunit